MSIPLLTPFLKFLAEKKWWLILLIIFGLVAFFWYHQAQAKKPKLTFGHPTRQDLTQTLEAAGVVNAKEKASLRFIAGGKVVFLGAKEGDAVKKWQTVATIDARDLQKRLEKNLNLYSQERNSWDQTKDDSKDKVLLTKDNRVINTEQLTLNNSVIDVELASIATSNTVMSTPIAGVLVSAPTNVSGVTLGPTDTFTVVNPTSLVFQAEVDEADIAQIQKGQKVSLKLDAYPDEPLETTVRTISYIAVQTSSGTAFVVEMPVSTAATASAAILDKYRLGMNGDATVELATRQNVLTVPLSATRERDSKFYVDVKTGPETYQEREIKVGLQTDDEVEVTGGLSETDEILLPS